MPTLHAHLSADDAFETVSKGVEVEVLELPICGLTYRVMWRFTRVPVETTWSLLNLSHRTVMYAGGLEEALKEHVLAEFHAVTADLSKVAGCEWLRTVHKVRLVKCHIVRKEG